MPEYDTYIVNAFISDTSFSGNPAGVCLMPEAASEDWMQAVAANLNLSETAFLHRATPAANAEWHIRYFTPVAEIALCGHATLAAGAVLFDKGGAGPGRIHLQTRHERLLLEPAGDALVLRLPRYALTDVDVYQREDIRSVTGSDPIQVFATAHEEDQQWVYAVYPSSQQIAELEVDQARLAASSLSSLCISAPGAEAGCDYVLRFFSPRYGIPEDPVTGAAQCGLAPYWSGKLGKTRLHGKQLSARGGDFTVEVGATSIRLQGRSAIVMKGLRCV